MERHIKDTREKNKEHFTNRQPTSNSRQGPLKSGISTVFLLEKANDHEIANQIQAISNFLFPLHLQLLTMITKVHQPK